MYTSIVSGVEIAYELLNAAFFWPCSESLALIEEEDFSPLLFLRLPCSLHASQGLVGENTLTTSNECHFVDNCKIL